MKTSSINELRELLEKASLICSNNLNVENIDLHSMMETLDEYVDELNAIENFEIYNENDED